MNFEKYTERSRGFVQSAQSLAQREGHQQFTPLHILKVLLDDSEGLAGGLIDRSGGNSRAILHATEDALNKMPKVSGAGAGQVYLAPATARLFAAAEQAAETARKVFEEGAIDANLPTVEIAANEIEAGIGLLALFVKAGLAASNGEARRHVQGGAVRINDTVVSDEKRLIGSGDVNADGVIKLSLGKKKHVLVKPV